MELEQLSKQVDWLDEERRKDKTRITSLEERINALEGNITALIHQNKEQSGEISRQGTLLSRIDNIDETILQSRIETKQKFEEQEKLFRNREAEIEKIRRSEIFSLENSQAEIRKELEQLVEIRRNLKIRMDEEIRLARIIDELRNRFETMRRNDEEYTRTIRLLDDGRRQDSKRLTDLTGEIAALRKRSDDNIGKIELNTISVKKLETKLNETVAVEAERREVFINFLNTQNLREVERDRVWKEWQLRFQLIETQAKDIENSLQALDATQRTVKRTQQVVEELSQKAERRINEITEVQRLSEERFRQEWVTFKADDQKRWTNYTLTLDEQRNEAVRQHEKLADRVIMLGDTAQEIQDILGQMNEQSEKQLQTLLSLVHEWVSTYERTIGRVR